MIIGDNYDDVSVCLIFIPGLLVRIDAVGIDRCRWV